MFPLQTCFFSAEEWFWRKGKSLSVTGTSFADSVTELCLIDSYCASETRIFPMTSPVALRQVMWPRRKPWQSMGLGVLELFVAAGPRTNPALQSGSSTSSNFWRRGGSGTCEDDSGFFGCNRILQFWPHQSRPKKSATRSRNQGDLKPYDKDHECSGTFVLNFALKSSKVCRVWRWLQGYYNRIIIDLQRRQPYTFEHQAHTYFSRHILTF